MSISTTVSIQIITLEVKTCSSHHLWGSFSKIINQLTAKVKGTKYQKIPKDFTERLFQFAMSGTMKV